MATAFALAALIVVLATAFAKVGIVKVTLALLELLDAPLLAAMEAQCRAVLKAASLLPKMALTWLN